MLFKKLRINLLEEVRHRIRSGEFSERGLARRLGVSQPHIHNVMAGVRTLSVDLADLMLVQLDIPLSRILPK